MVGPNRGSSLELWFRPVEFVVEMTRGRKNVERHHDVSVYGSIKWVMVDSRHWWFGIP